MDLHAMVFIPGDTLAGRVAVWPDGEAWRMIPVDAEH
jgi:hypothetical protein